MKKNWLEWSVFAVSSLVIAAIVGVLIREAMTERERKPSFRVELGETERTGDHFRLPLTITNLGDSTAEDVQVEVKLVARGGAEVERAEVTIAFVPRKSTRTAAVLFRGDPRIFAPEARVTGYAEP